MLCILLDGGGEGGREAAMHVRPSQPRPHPLPLFSDYASRSHHNIEKKKPKKDPLDISSPAICLIAAE